MKEAELNVKKSYIEAQLAEFGRVLPGIVLLTNREEIRDLQYVLERILYETWDAAEAPFLDEIKRAFANH